MATTRVGSTAKYSQGWESVFGGGRGGKAKPAKSKVAAKKKSAKSKVAAKKKSAKKRAKK